MFEKQKSKPTYSLFKLNLAKIESFCLLAALLFVSLPVTAANGYITLRGKVDTALTGKYESKQLIIKIHDGARELNSEEQLITVPLNINGYFNVRISTKQNLIYLSFWKINNNESNGILSGDLLPIQFPLRIGQGMEEIYAFENRDNLSLDINKFGKLIFSGKNSEKLICQSEIFNLNVVPKSYNVTRINLINTRNVIRWLRIQDSLQVIEKQARIKILESYKQSLSTELYQILSLNAISGSAYKMIINLRQYLTDKKARDDVRNYFLNYLNEGDGFNDSVFGASSIYYPRYIYQMEYYAGLFSIQDHRFHENLYERLRTKYTGEIRAQLLLIYFRELKDVSPDKIKLLINDALATANEKSYRDALQKWRQKQLIVFPFELEDVNGMTHRLSDYTGKLLIIDFWFTGCSWCKKLSIAMQPIIEKYKDNNKVVFITVSEDKDKKRWLESVAKGEYTNPLTVNLYTNGQGNQHPFMKYYNFNGAPQQLIINQKGLLITHSPPRPDTDNLIELSKEHPDPNVMVSSSNSKAFIKIIEDSINNIELGK